MKMDTYIDLRSDTVTRPSAEMINFMLKAEVGDDVFGDDPTVIGLERKAASMFGMESALFCPSGTMTNQIAIKAHTRPGDEVICDRTSHVYKYEGGGIGFNSGCSVRLLDGDRGRFTPLQVMENINPDNEHYPVSRLVVAENTCNKGGGSFYHLGQLREIATVCRSANLAFHLDGARLFNALAETGDQPTDYGKTFDSISICLSKGLGAPVGSLLLGSSDFIKRGRRIRKVFGGGMRQAGYLAAAGIYALDHNISRLNEDHRRAKELAAVIREQPYVKLVLPVETNIIVFELESLGEDDFLDALRKKGILAVGFGPGTIRMVTHLDVDDAMMEKVKEILVGIR